MSLYTHIISNIFDHADAPYPNIQGDDYLLTSMNGEGCLEGYFSEIHGTSKLDRMLGKVNHKDLQHIMLMMVSEAQKVFIQNSEFLFSLLSMDYGKKRLIDSLSFNYAGPMYIDLFPNFLNNLKVWRKALDDHNTVTVKGKEWSKYDLTCMGVPIKLLHDCVPLLISVFGLHAHKYIDMDMPVTVESGDVVIDCGAFVGGDTALLFSYLAGKTGHIYGFEFMKSSLDVFKKNLLLNPKFSENITIIPNAVSNVSNETMYFDRKGDNIAMQIYADLDEEHKQSSTTLSIDDMVKQQGLQKVDFIKMDIEGAELMALKGAEETIKKFKPKLAISLYHKPEDMFEIPKYISDLNEKYHLGYKFGFDQFHLENAEKMLFCKA